MVICPECENELDIEEVLDLERARDAVGDLHQARVVERAEEHREPCPHRLARLGVAEDDAPPVGDPIDRPLAALRQLHDEELGAALVGQEVEHLLEPHGEVPGPIFEQLAFHHLMERGDYERHIRRARGVYRTRRDALAAALAAHLPDAPVEGITAGLHVLVRLPPGTDDTAVSSAALASGVRVEPLSLYAVDRRDATGLVIGYGRIHEAAIDRAVALVAEAVAAAGRVRPA